MAITGGAAAVSSNWTTSNGAGSSPSITLTSGRQLLVALAWEMGSGTANDRALNGVTLSGGGTVTMIGSPMQLLGSRNTKVQLGYIASISSSGAQTVSVAAMTGSNTVVATSILVREWDSGDTASFLDAEGIGNVGDGSDEILAESITTTQANDAIFGIVSWSAGNIETLTGNSLTWTQLTMTDNYTKVEAFECLDVGATGTKTPQIDIDAFAVLGIKGAAFKAFGSGGGGGVPKTTKLALLGVG